ncbi:hypothetical protein BDQ12DRAFT_661104 [Crucibulum laeve]|uniref:BZIP domain-containing protein n=1 Tax=Crucibulum laeve TaxID=68775 RepID=A0A5C3MHC8_9AGAR|nr:hypothetical protein BDQ12DRAFT_661104 [Crucibulum laeve]
MLVFTFAAFFVSLLLETSAASISTTATTADSHSTPTHFNRRSFPFCVSESHEICPYSPDELHIIDSESDSESNTTHLPRNSQPGVASAMIPLESPTPIQGTSGSHYKNRTPKQREEAHKRRMIAQQQSLRAIAIHPLRRQRGVAAQCRRQAARARRQHHHVAHTSHLHLRHHSPEIDENADAVVVHGEARTRSDETAGNEPSPIGGPVTHWSRREADAMRIRHNLQR